MNPKPRKSGGDGRFAALLRAVNLGSHNKVPMASLREVAETLGLDEARTLLQSGNLVFRDARGRTAAALESALERAVRDALGVDTEVFVRTAAELAAAIAANPFPAEAKSDPSHLVVSFHRAPHDVADVARLQAAIPGRERVKSAGRELYIVYPDGIGRSRLTPAIAAKHIRSSGTARNWNTVTKLAALLDG